MHQCPPGMQPGPHVEFHYIVDGPRAETPASEKSLLCGKGTRRRRLEMWHRVCAGLRSAGGPAA